MRTGTRLEVDVKNFVDRSCQCSMGSGNDPGYISRHKTGHLRFQYARKWSFWLKLLGLPSNEIRCQQRDSFFLVISVDSHPGGG